MKDFDSWFNQSTREVRKPREQHEAELEEDGTIWRNAAGVWMCECCVCRKNYELPIDTMEVYAGCEFHCGGSPSCCP